MLWYKAPLTEESHVTSTAVVYIATFQSSLTVCG